MSDIGLFAPEIALSIAMLIVFTTGLFVKNRTVFTLIAIAGAGASYILLEGAPQTVFNGMARVDYLSVTFKAVCLIAMSLTLLLSHGYSRIREGSYSEYCALIMLSTIGMMLMSSAGDMLIVYLSLELMSLSIYVLAGFLRDDARSNEAALKYFMLGTLAAIIFLFSIALVYGITSTTNLSKVADYIKINGLASNPVLLIALVSSVCAFAFKIAAAPFHQWSPDAYEGAPTTITAFMSVGPKAAAFATFSRVFYDAFIGMQANWSSLFIIIAVLTMAVGNILALSQRNLKRMLAYSSIAHAGYMLLGFAAASQAGIQSVAFYMIIYVFMNMGAFAVVISLKNGEELEGYKGLWKRHPLTAFSMLIFMAALTGIPPTAGFAGKLNLFMAAIQAGFVVPVIFAVIFSILSAFYYLRVVAYIFFADTDYAYDASRDSRITEGISITIAALFVCLIGIIPSLVL